MTHPRLLILDALTPIQKIAQHIGKPEPRISSHFVRTMIPLLNVGDVLLSREEWRLTNPFVPGFWGHAALYVGNGLVVEAIGDYREWDKQTNKFIVKNGVRIEDVNRFFYTKDSAAILRAPLPIGIRASAANIACSLVGRPYDYGFSPSTNAFYCSEVVTYCLSEASESTFNFNVREKFGVYTSTPQDLWDAAAIDDKFVMVGSEINK
jgi:hypothetical protein